MDDVVSVEYGVVEEEVGLRWIDIVRRIEVEGVWCDVISVEEGVVERIWIVGVWF